MSDHVCSFRISNPLASKCYTEWRKGLVEIRCTHLKEEEDSSTGLCECVDCCSFGGSVVRFYITEDQHVVSCESRIGDVVYPRCPNEPVHFPPSEVHHTPEIAVVITSSTV